MNEEYDPNEYPQQEDLTQQPADPQEAIPQYMREEKITFDDVRKHLSGPAISVVLHIIILAVAGTAVLFEPPAKEKEEISVEMKTVENVKPPDPPKVEEIQEIQETQDFVDRPVDRPTLSQTSIDTSSPVESVSTSDVQMDSMDIVPTLAVDTNKSALQLPATFSNRSSSGRKGSLGRYNRTGSRRGETVVLKALRWLKKVQNEDGSWGDLQKNAQGSVAATSVATLAFLAHGETNQSEEFGGTVTKSLQKLCEWVEGMKSDTGLIFAPGNGYAHAMVAYAVSEGYAMTKIPRLEAAMNRIIYSIVQGQNNEGSYDYSFRKSGRSDLSVAGWNFQAMKAAYAGGCTVEGLKEAIEKASKAIRTIHYNKAGDKYGFCYQYTAEGVGADGKKTGGKSGVSMSMTCVGTLCLQLFGDGKTREAKRAMEFIKAYKCSADQEPLTMDFDKPIPGMHCYIWYYMTQAVFQGEEGKGKVWEAWNKSFSNCLVKEQSNAGYWDSPSTRNAHKEPADKQQAAMAQDGGHSLGTEMNQRVWSTSLCCLMLEVYYRFLPTFQQPHANVLTKEDTEDVEDISL